MSADQFIVGCVQLCPGEDRDANLARVVDGVRSAKDQGAALVALPEYATFLHASGAAMRANADEEASDPSLPKLQKLAIDQKVWLLVGSLALNGPEGRLVNRSYLLSPSGDVVASYDKIHMFDATLKNGRVIRESSAYAPGGRAVVARTPWACIGMSVCYDARFPQLYRALAQGGAEVLAVPAAFTRQTGTLHWKALLQARAIENGAFIIAPATCGEHPGGHQTYGHAMIIDPNGQILAEAGEASEVICAPIDLGQVALARSRIPSLSHDRIFELAHAG
ncbi:carbon-nitrogen hydrolase family protein [Variovorax sp. HJSM1_2]|uniref:carbon-nitrogen hydrolase family protein n=1 Tax=Variovorax sp. HJSM1_2 TaxID=3366263 RepID=UPI003BDF0E75